VKPFDENGAFCPTANGDGLRRVALRGAAVTMLSQTAVFAVQMLATVVLARLLTPADFGLLAMVTTFSLLLMNFGLNGFTEVVLQREDVDHRLASNLFWINVAMGIVLAVGFAAAGPLLAWLYAEPRVIAVAGAIALTILFTSVSVEHLALLMRAMRFADVSANQILARAISVSVAIVLACMGSGYWALVAGAVALPLATSAGAWIWCRWIPGLPRRDDRTIPALRFAIYTYGCFTVGYFMRNMDNLLIGWRFGPEALGLYKKAFDLFTIPVEVSAPVTRVAVSALSRLTGDSARRGRHLLGALAPLAFIGMGLGVNLTLIGKDLLFLLLGPQWTESGLIFTFLAPATGLMLIYLVQVWIHLSIGRADRLFRWGIFEFTMITVLFLLGLRWGPLGVAAAWVAYFCVFTIPALRYAGRPAGLGVASIVDAVWKYVLASALAGAASAVIIRGLPSFSGASGPMAALMRIVMVSIVFATLYLCAVILFHRGLEPIRHVTRLLRDIVGPAPLEPVSKA